MFPWPGTGAVITDNSSLFHISLSGQNSFPFNDVFNLSRFCGSHISDSLSTGAIWTPHHSYLHDGLTFLLEAKMHVYAVRECNLLIVQRLAEALVLAFLQEQRDRLHLCTDVSSCPVCLSLQTHKHAKQGSFLCLCLVREGGEVWSK